MKTSIKFPRLSWKMGLALFVLALWASFWIYGGWVEQDFALGLAIGLFPGIVFLILWAEFRKKKTSDSEEYIRISKYVKTKQKRKYERLAYPSTKRPLLKIGDHELEIIDISERGIKFLNDEQLAFDQIIHGTTVLLSGESVIVEGEVSRSLNRECSLVINPIPKAIISKEKRILSEV